MRTILFISSSTGVTRLAQFRELPPLLSCPKTEEGEDSDDELKMDERFLPRSAESGDDDSENSVPYPIIMLLDD